MTESQVRFIDISAAQPRAQDLWPAVLIPKSQIDDEIQRLCDIARQDGAARAALVVHPKAKAPGLGLAPGIDVTINVLLPGESTRAVRRNSTQVDMCIRGSGRVSVGGESFCVEQFDVWNSPSLQYHSATNDGKEPWVRLTYSNAPLLEKLEVHYVEEAAEGADLAASGATAEEKEQIRRARDAAERIQLGDSGAQLLGYEYLIDIEPIPSRALLWPWKLVSQHIGRVRGIGGGYTGRRLYVLYNPATRRLIGTTNNFFATIAAVPGGNLDIPHRHTSAAINYYFEGHGLSNVMGRKFEWQAGDLMLSAPGWAIHNHASGPDGFYSLTIQDHPLMIGMESLIWQETMKDPIKNLGTQIGFQTNLAELLPS